MRAPSATPQISQNTLLVLLETLSDQNLQAYNLHTTASMSQRSEPIAIIGSGCRFPGNSSSPSKLWDLLHEPRDLLTKIPADRFNAEAFYHPDPTHHGTTNVQDSYFLSEDPQRFDAQFFGIQPLESDSIDPQQRMLLETVYESISAAGLTIEGLQGSSTAVYVGLMCDDWSGILTRDWDTFPTYTATGMARSIISNRVSYFFDWHGPSMTIDTACSSSLVAVHQAIQTLRSGGSEVAIAAGANLMLSPGELKLCHKFASHANPNKKQECILQRANSTCFLPPADPECGIKTRMATQEERVLQQWSLKPSALPFGMEIISSASFAKRD